MNYREEIREYISCPQLGDNHYGKWGALRVEQRLLIKRLLDELDCADNYIKKVYLENQKLKEKIENLTTLVVCGDTKQIKNTAQYKLEQLQQRIEKAIEYIENKEIDTLHFNSKDFLDTSIAGELLEILGGENNR